MCTAALIRNRADSTCYRQVFPLAFRTMFEVLGQQAVRVDPEHVDEGGEA